MEKVEEDLMTHFDTDSFEIGLEVTKTIIEFIKQSEYCPEMINITLS